MVKSLLLVIAVFSSSMAMCGDLVLESKGLGEDCFLFQFGSERLDCFSEDERDRFYPMFEHVEFEYSANQKCTICLENLGDRVLALNCGHMFHFECFRKKSKFFTNNLSEFIKCHADKCDYQIRRDMFCSYIDNNGIDKIFL